MNNNDEIEVAICNLISEFRKWREMVWHESRSHNHTITKHDLIEIGSKIMSAISDFAAKQTAFNDRLDKAVEGVTQDVGELNKKIEQLQNTPGVITPEDQALLNDIEARSDAITTKLEALDALTPPVPPV